MDINCPKCGRPSLVAASGNPLADNTEHYCRKHYTEWKESVFLDNSDPENLGIVKWVKECLGEHARDPVPDFHILFYALCLSLYDPFLINKFERLLEIVSWRESAKSTVLTFFLPAFIIAFNDKPIKLRRFILHEDLNTTVGYRIEWLDEVVEGTISERYIMIVSETGDMAEDFILRIRDEFTINTILKFYHPGKIQNAFDAVDGEWTKRAFKYNNCFIAGIGQRQQSRGRIKGTSRVSLLILDDIYSERNTITDTTRDAIRNWWDKAIKNSVDMKSGRVINAGTIVHEDTVLVDCMNNELWRTVKLPLMPVEKFDQFISEHMQADFDTGKITLPHDDIKNDYERMAKQREYYQNIQKDFEWKLSWPERIGLYEIALMIKETITSTKKKKTIDNIYQEYFHVIIPEGSKRYTKDMFQPSGPFEIFQARGMNWIKWPLRFTEPVPISIQFGLDMAAGLPTSDDTVITIAGALPDYTRLIIAQIIGKIKMRDTLKDKTNARYDMVAMNREDVHKIGYADEMFRQYKVYDPYQIKIGTGNAGEIELAEQIRFLYTTMNVIINIETRAQEAHEGKKADRITNNTHGLYATKSVWHGPGLTTLEHQLEFLQKTSFDDAADSMEVAVHDIQIPEMMTFYEDMTPEEKPKESDVYVWERHKVKKEYDYRDV